MLMVIRENTLDDLVGVINSASLHATSITKDGERWAATVECYSYGNYVHNCNKLGITPKRREDYPS